MISLIGECIFLCMVGYTWKPVGYRYEWGIFRKFMWNIWINQFYFIMLFVFPLAVLIDPFIWTFRVLSIAEYYPLLEKSIIINMWAIFSYIFGYALNMHKRLKHAS